MRFAIACLVVAVLVRAAPDAVAGPLCEDRAGEAVRCVDPRAMPLGWTRPLDERLKHPVPGPPEPTPAQLGGVFALIVMLFALIALMPNFDGWTPRASCEEVDEGEGRD